jgi:hypothetical protein
MEIRDSLKVRKKSKTIVESLFDFNAVYKIYPRKEGKTKGIEVLSREIKTEEQYNLLMLATRRYADKIKREAIETKFTMLFSTFAGRWKDYLPLQESQSPSQREQVGEMGFLL